MLKTYVIDTNIFLYDPESIYSFKDAEVVIPFIVLEELDRKKNGVEEINKNARTIIRILDKLRETGSLNAGVYLNDNIFVRVDCATETLIDNTLADNKIINIAHQLNTQGKDVTLVSRDINVRVKCDSVGIKTLGYEKQEEKYYAGFREVVVTQGQVDMLYSGEPLYIENEELYPNEYVLLRSDYNPKHSGMAKFIAKDKPMQKVTVHKDVWGIAPKNKEQVFALDALNDMNIPLVTLAGAAGTGKTLLAVASGLQQVVEKKIYKKLIILRPNVAISKEANLGFLPGTLEEKLAEWITPIFDQFSILQGSKSANYFDQLIADGFIEFQAVGYVRGRSLHNAYVILDETQNLSKHEIKTLITRVGKDSKIVLTGDTSQIDTQYLSKQNNGLMHVVNNFKKYDVAAHLLLSKGERSTLATLASEIL